MRIDTSNNATDITATTGEVREFSIEVNPVAFSLLSQKLYSRPVEAVIRELICNAYDAHVAAGTLDKAIHVGLPTSLMPEFTVTDFGTGLSDSDVMRLYTTFFASNKRDSNSSIGGFGLGSKSPFAVADSFTVESRFNGVKSIYVATKDSGAPKLVRMSSVATSEPSGMTIRVPVKYNFDDWHFKARVFASTFGHPIVGLGDFTNLYTHPKNTYLHGVLFRGDGGNGMSMIRVGKTVTYPANNLPDFFRGCIVDMPIGSLTIAPTREELVFDDATLTAIKVHLESVYALITKEWFDKFKTIDSDFATPAEATIAAVKEAEAYLPQRMNKLIRLLSWKGKQLDPDKVAINNDTNTRLGKGFKSFNVPMDELHAFKVRINSNNYAQLNKHDLVQVLGAPITGTPDVEITSSLYNATFDPLSPWFMCSGSYDYLIVSLDEQVTDYSDKTLLKRLRSAPVVANRLNHTRFRGGLTLLLMPEAYVKELADVYWIKDYTTEPYLKDKVVRLSELKPYEQPKQVRSTTTPKRTNFHEFVTYVGLSDPNYDKLEIDYDTCVFGNEPLLFVPMTYSGMFQDQKNRLAKAANVLGKRVYCFMDKARKAYDAAPLQVKAKWINLLDADAVVDKVLLTNPRFKAEIYKQSSILPELPKWFKFHTKLDDVKVKNFMAKVNSTLSTEYTYNYETFYEGIPDNSVVRAVKAKVEALRAGMRASLEVELKLALNPYQPYLQSIACNDEESVVKLVNLVYSTTKQSTKGSK